MWYVFKDSVSVKDNRHRLFYIGEPGYLNVFIGLL